MGKPTGFIEFDRVPARQRPPLERIRDWSDEHPPYDEETLRRQGARCMDCGVPFCHTGKLIGGMAAGCPLSNLIPDWNDLVYRGQWREAMIRLEKTNNFPEFTGRVCPAPCEGSCCVAINGAPVAIKSIEYEIVERAWASGFIRPEPPLSRTGMKVAVVGSGPSGLACAAQLNRAGHDVTVLERSDRIGGLLAYGIPNMKLDKGVVERRIRLMAEEGVRFLTSTEVGGSVSSTHLRADYDASVICIGSTMARDLPIEGRSLEGIHLAMDYLRASTRRLLGQPAGPGEDDLTARDRRVVVIGGGDTGADCVGTAIRQGALGIEQLEILPRPPEHRAADNPWPQWPKVYRLDYAQQEAAALWGDDPRRYSIQTKRFIGNESGRLAAVETVLIEWVPGTDGWPPAPREIEGSERIIPCDVALLALGFLGPERSVPQALGCQLDQRGNIVTDDEKMTTVPGVFAAGDCSRGQSLVVWAIHEGRRAARGVDRFLMGGETVLPA